MLVDYGDSSDEASAKEDDANDAVLVGAKLPLSEVRAISDSKTKSAKVKDEVEEEYRGRIPASVQPESLPQPPTVGKAQQLAGNRNEALRASSRKRGGKVLIQALPLFKSSGTPHLAAEFDSDSDSDGDFVSLSRRKVSSGAAPTCKTGLLSLLPTPQALTVKEGAGKALIPQSVVRHAAQARVIQRVAKCPAPQAPDTVYCPPPPVLLDTGGPDPDDEDAVVQARIAALIAADKNASSCSYSPLQAQEDAIQHLSDIPESERIRLEGRRRVFARNDAPQFIEVKQADQLCDVTITMTKNITTDDDESAHAKPGKFEGPSVARNKNQITWLAHKAKEREFDLKNQWADNKFNKRMSMQKYGF